MLGFTFKYEPFWLTPFTNKMYQLPNAKMGDQSFEEVKGGRVAVSGTIKSKDVDTLTKFAEQLPHIVCVINQDVLVYKYMIPDNGMIEFMSSVQETNCINIHIYDEAWAEESHRGTLFIRNIWKINDISRHDNYNWFVDIEHAPMDDLRGRLDHCGYVDYIFSLNEYINPQTYRSRFLVNNSATKAFQRIYESTGVGYGLNIFVCPVKTIKKIFDGVPEEWV